jgi:alpha-mannosidase
MKKPYEIHVISNTHWDREWLCNFQETRMMLVEFFDRLLDVLDHEPGYHSYLLDSQVAPVEDYLEVHPEKREAIVRYVTGKRLFIGPWYTCPEGFCVNGESLVRNLLYGHRVARSFGHVMKVGHTPFSYGQNSQMPQIYAGFGIDTILFYHGVGHDDTPNEFIFEGADGTRLLASQMSSGARYNFYHNVYRRMLYDERIDDREYAWPRGGLPFHLCSERHCMGHHLLLDPVRGYQGERLEECIRPLREAEIGTATTRYLAFMDGHDSSVADTVTLRIIEDARQYLGNDIILHSSLPDLMAKVKKAAHDLVVLKGERRVPKPMGARVHLYSDVLSARTRMKRLNALAETALQHWAEPFAAVAHSLGREYPVTLLDMAWKTLLKSHAHDSIAGTGVDEIEEDMTYRLRQVINISDGVASRSLQHIQELINNADAAPGDVLLTVFNPSAYARSEVVTAVLDVPPAGFESFAVIDADDGSIAPTTVVSRKPCHAVVNHADNATAMMACDRVTIRFEAKKVPGLGYATYRLLPGASCGQPVTGGSLVRGHNHMENEFLQVKINADGTFRLKDKRTGVVFDDLHYFEDGGEAGQAWMHIEPAHDSIVTSHGRPALITLEEDGPLSARYRIEHRMRIPYALNENGGDPWKRLDGGQNSSCRTDETREMILVSTISLERGARAVDIVTRFENPCKNHRLRVVFPTRLAAPTCSVESAFDVVEREIVHGPDSPWAKSIHPTFPMHRFVDVSDGKAGLAVINDGLREYEVTSDQDRAIAVTLMRAFQVELTTVSKRWESHPEMTLSQCFGVHEFHYRVYPHSGRWEGAETFREAERLAMPLEPAQAGGHGGNMPKRWGFLTVSPANVILSALKQSEDGRGFVVRVFNPTSAAVKATLSFARQVSSARRVTLEETPLEALKPSGNSLAIKLGPKKIATIKIRLRS